MSTYTVENVPMPKAAIRRKYPFAEMRVGQSFAFDAKDGCRVSSAAAAYGKRHGVRLSITGNRCYCVAKSSEAQS